jgi:ubiquinone/menaquinone biosynthesis C-methylase UbiE
MQHKDQIENLYREIKFPGAIDWWSSYYARDELDVRISDSRHLDAVRQKIEDRVWRRIVPQNGRVLDLGCGRGFFAKRLKQAVGRTVHVVGLDLSEIILHKARSDHGDLSFLVGRGEKLPFKDDSFDVVMIITAFEYIEDQPDPIIHEVHRILKKGGFFYICLHKPSIDPFFIPNIARRFDRKTRRIDILQPNCENREQLNHPYRPGCKVPLAGLRARLRSVLDATGFSALESRCLLHQFSWHFYKRLSPRIIPALIFIGKWLNRLPLKYYKNLEYWLLQKPPALAQEDGISSE